MEIITIEATKSSPFVLIDPVSHQIKITGESYPENAAKFFGPILSYVNEYVNSTEAKIITVDIHLSYFNSSSSKALLNLFEILDQAASENKQIEVNWCYHPENETIFEAGEEFEDETTVLKFNFVQTTD